MLEPEQRITPDAWVIVEINHDNQQYSKVLSGWSSSYLYGDSWRLSSRISSIDINVDKDSITVFTESGSSYSLHKSCQRLSMATSGIYNELKEKFADNIELVTL